jgi:hypothetical protein
MGRRRLGPGRGRLDPSRQQSWVCPRIQERPQWGCSSCADPTGELGRCSVTAHHPDGVIVGVIRSADLPWDGFGRAPRRHRSIGVTGRCRRRPATSRPRDGDPSRRHTGRPSSSPVVGSRPSNMAWNPATDASPCSPRLRAPAPYHRPGPLAVAGQVLLVVGGELAGCSTPPDLPRAWRCRPPPRFLLAFVGASLVEALCLMALSEGRSVRRM